MHKLEEKNVHVEKPADTFKMKKFSNVTSKVRQDLEKQNAAEDIRPHQGEEAKVAGRPRLASARGPQRGSNQVVFGRSYSNSGLNCAKP